MRIGSVTFAVLAAAAAAGLAVDARQSSSRGARLGDMTWVDAERTLTADSVVVLPLGAGAKEHGPHLRLGNDATLAAYLAERLLETAPVIVAPPLTYSYYPAFVEYPGTTTVSLDTARTMTVEVVRSLARYGPRRFYVLNTGISTARPLAAAAEALAADGILLEYTDLGAELEAASARVKQEEGGTHADEVETSMMLYIDPSVVDMSRAVKDYSPSTGPLRLTRTRGGRGTFSASGVWGDPTLATSEKGREIVEGLVAALVRDIEHVRKSPLPSAAAAPPPDAAPPAPAGARTMTGPRMPSGCTPGDERSIRNVGNLYPVHWANTDAAALADLWTEDGDMVHPDGLTERSRETIRANRTAMFQRREYRGSRHPLRIGNIRCLANGVAIVDAKWELRGVTDGAGKPLPTFEGLATLVLQRRGELNTWLIAAYRYTLNPTPVPPPTWLKRPGIPGDVRPPHP